MSTALFVGDLTLDLTMRIDHVPAPDEKVHVTECIESVGGVVANASVACAKSGGSARLLVQIGRDNAAAVAWQAIGDQGVAVEAMVAEGRTARVVILIEPHGEKRLLLDPGVSLYPSAGAIEDISLDGVAWVHTAVYGSAAWRLVERCRALGIPFSLDLEPATFPNGVGTLDALFPGALLFCNDRAASIVGPGAEQMLLARGAAAVIRTRGASGARLILPDRIVEVPAPQFGPVVDTTGAGDCLAGWFVGERLKARRPEDALHRAVTAATLSCRQPGAQSSYPEQTEVDQSIAPSYRSLSEEAP